MDAGAGAVRYTAKANESVLVPDVRFPLLARGILTAGAYLRLCEIDQLSLRLDTFALPGGQQIGSLALQVGGALPMNSAKMLVAEPPHRLRHRLSGGPHGAGARS